MTCIHIQRVKDLINESNNIAVGDYGYCQSCITHSLVGTRSGTGGMFCYGIGCQI